MYSAESIISISRQRRPWPDAQTDLDWPGPPLFARGETTFCHDAHQWRKHVSVEYLSSNVRKRTFGYARPAKFHCDQPAHWYSLIRIFTGCILVQRVQSSSSGQRRLIRLRGCAGWFESSLGAHMKRYVFSHLGSFIIGFLIAVYMYWLVWPWSETDVIQSKKQS